MEEEFVIDANGNNAKVLRCPHCNCKVLRPGFAKLELLREVSPVLYLSTTGVRLEEGAPVPEDFGIHCWVLTDIFDFENIGFLKDASDGNKYIICADCERQVIGLHKVQNPSKIWLVSKLVKQE
eukprot:ANDGO_04275.mRNA.1 Guanine nucleotide exchange factor MSS4 homolog